MTLEELFPKLSAAGYDLTATYHANAILSVDFQDAARELDDLVSSLVVPIKELVGSGGGEAKLTQRLRRALHDEGWRKHNFEVEKLIDQNPTYASSHEVDHVKGFPAGKIAMEIEWNNKDPFFDRDLESFQRLHADGAISLGAIITRGRSFQDGIGELIRDYANAAGFNSPEALADAGIQRTPRQLRGAEQLVARNGYTYPDAWAKTFTSDKFGAATTHWAKLEARLARGVGSPCPLLAIGIPLGVVQT